MLLKLSATHCGKCLHCLLQWIRFADEICINHAVAGNRHRILGADMDETGHSTGLASIFPCCTFDDERGGPYPDAPLFYPYPAHFRRLPL